MCAFWIGCILLQVQTLQWPLLLNWRQGKALPIDGLVCAFSVFINEMVYCGGNYSHDVIQLTPENGDWSMLPRPPVTGFAMTSLNFQLVVWVVMLESECGTVTIVSGSVNTIPCLLDEACQLLWATRNTS